VNRLPGVVEAGDGDGEAVRAHARDGVLIRSLSEGFTRTREDVAVHAGHEHVRDHQARRRGARPRERLARVRGLA